MLGTSLATVKWDIPLNTPEGTYRITHTGHFKSMFFGINEYYGASEPFEVSKGVREDGKMGKAGGGWLQDTIALSVFLNSSSYLCSLIFIFI